MNNVPDHILNEFLRACHKAAKHGLMRCSSGNLSRRVDEEHLLATASRSWMENVSADQVTVCRIADGTVLNGPKPTVEIGFHTEILRTRPDVNVVMHFQTPYATTLASQETTDINYFVIPEIPFYIGHVARVPFLMPGSEELADAVAGAMQNHDMVVMGNHGLVTVAADYDHVIQNAVFFELACEVIVRGGNAVRPLSEEDASALLAMRKHTAENSSS
jgi:ribulose-5-phosphate 4-epimerase/fuculose-1-phosphate aldolase